MWRLRFRPRQFIHDAAFKLACAFLFLVALSTKGSGSSTDRPLVLLIVGAEGEEIYQPIFIKAENQWREAAKRGGAEVITIGTDPIPNPESDEDRKKVEAFMGRLKETNSSPAWIVMIGHGTDNGKEAKFNLRGPDFSATELAGWLRPAARPIIVVNTSSSSGAFIKPLSGPNRIIVTATRSGGELNYARFGQFMAEAIGSTEADLDKDEQTSLLEAFLMASRKTVDFYKDEGRLATEHALVDDNGDGAGTPADWFQGVRAIKKAQSGAVDGRRAQQVHLISNSSDQKLSAAAKTKRDELELSMAALRDRKGSTPKEEYYRELETLLLEIARLYEASETSPP